MSNNGLIAVIQHHGKDDRPEEEYNIHEKDTQRGLDECYICKRSW
jgi:hypothetical protein